MFLSRCCSWGEETLFDSDGGNTDDGECIRPGSLKLRAKDAVLLPEKNPPNDARLTTRNASKGETPIFPSPFLESAAALMATARFVSSQSRIFVVATLGEGHRGIGVPGGVAVLLLLTLLVSLLVSVKREMDNGDSDIGVPRGASFGGGEYMLALL